MPAGGRLHAYTSIRQEAVRERDLPVWLCKPQRWPPDPTNYSISLCLPYPYPGLGPGPSPGPGQLGIWWKKKEVEAPGGSHQQSTWWRAQ